MAADNGDKPELQACPPVSGNGRFPSDRTSDAMRLSPLETRLVDLLAGGATVEEAATALGKSARTLRRRKATPRLIEAVRQRTSEALALARATLASAANRAARELDKLCTSATPDHARIAACKACIELAGRSLDAEEIETLLVELRAAERARGVR
jgi:hypothetical protein